MRYLGDGGIYAATEGCLGTVNASKRALSSARVDAVAGVWNMAGVDLSWVPAFDAAYWERRNRLLLLQFVTLDADGQITGFKPEAFPKLVELMAGLVGAIQSNEPGAFPDYMNGLSPDEQYVLIWLGTVIPDILYGIGVDRARGMTATEGNPASGVITMLQLFTELCEQTGLPNPMKDLLSFTADGGQFHNNNVRGSIQQKAGYSDFIELWGPALGMDLDTTVTTFVHDGREYRLQSWGGTYGYGATYGGEIGLYSREAPKSGEDAYKSMSVRDMKANIKTLTTTQVNSICRTYDTVEGKDQPEIVMTVLSSVGDKPLVQMAGKTYWSYTVRPIANEEGKKATDYRPGSVEVNGRLRLSDDSLARAMEGALQSSGVDANMDPNHILHVSW